MTFLVKEGLKRFAEAVLTAAAIHWVCTQIDRACNPITDQEEGEGDA